MTGPAETPLTQAEFAARMARLGPFEAAPHLAIACSGGADSLALVLLAQDWARSVGGRVDALVVDHAMRPESGAEAARVAGWLAAREIPATVLTRQGSAPGADRQAAARHARYALIAEWCGQAGVLHLLLGHHRQDQAETLLLRLARGSGVDGLAAMAPITEGAGLRLLRPLLDVPRGRLVALLRAEGQEFVEDPSNDDPAYARVRMRRMLPGLAAEGLTPARLADTARRLARARAALEAAATDLLAGAATIYPQGYAILAPDVLRAAPEEVGLRATARVLGCIGGSPYAPRLERLERLYDWLVGGGAGDGRTLAGCRILRRGAAILLCREPDAAAESCPAVDGAIWDGRYRLSLRGFADGTARFGGLGAAGWSEILARRPELRESGPPAAVRPTLPAIFDLDGLVAVPHLRYRRNMAPPRGGEDAVVTFLPARALGAAGFAIGADFA